ncbi:MAG: ATP-binding protein [Solirubrobacteraceae bacterium MAG38_C4-C5]|nr:ATP-binding protein [Candidatus Siliceabacter maunaloa]
MSEHDGDEPRERVRGLALRFGGGLVRQLGAQLYPSATASVAELISNAWDANATRVWVTMPFGDWTSGEIVVVDDGHGMTFEQARDLYLHVGLDRRKRGQRTEDDLRLAHGRKGIGKLAAFGTGRLLEVRSRRQGGQEVAFGMDYDEIRKLEGAEDYEVLKSTDDQPLADPDGHLLAHGTRIRLSRLRLKRRLNEDDFMRSMSRRFVLSDLQMQIFINGRKLERYVLNLEYRFPEDGVPEGAAVDDGWVKEIIDGDKEVRWWMGFTPKPLNVEGEQGVSVVSRGKLVQAPFIFRRFQGTEGQIGQEYLVGEVQADWLDPEHPVSADDDEEADVITSNRDSLQLEDERMEPFVDWGRRRVSWALSRRVALRQQDAERTLAGRAAVQQALRAFPSAQRPALRRIATSLLELDVSDDDLVDVLLRVDDVRADQVIRRALDAVPDDSEQPAVAVWREARQLAEVDARTFGQLLSSRMLLLERLLEHDAPDADVLADAVLASPWLFGPGWEVAERTDRRDQLVLRDREREASMPLDAKALADPNAGELFELLDRSLEQHRTWQQAVATRDVDGNLR